MTCLKSIRILFVASLFVAFSHIAHAAPSHIFLTYSGAPESSVDINIILPRQVDGVFVYYDTADQGDVTEKYTFIVKAHYIPTPMELSDGRVMYVARITDLKPGTDYSFLVDEKKYGASSLRKFRTLPGCTAPLRFVNGGDMGVADYIEPLLTLAAKTDPDFAVIGGDIAYVNGLLGGYANWDSWLKNWDDMMVTTDGRMIPIVTAIGNHETNRYATGDLALNAPWYSSLFGRQGEHVYYSRHFGDNLILFSLDSGHTVPHDGAQAEWLAGEMKANAAVKYKFAAYHIPLYPAHRAYEGSGSAAGRAAWGGLFDEYGLTVGLEHHDHVLKRTKPLRGGEVVEQGTVFIGDGCFGRGAREIDPQPRWYNAVEGSIPHFWVVNVRDSGLSFKAIDFEGITRDEFTLP
tara:strand:- start:653 stop:1867 length:1215 start_codon:yes stop_codon:yes gene_type:complete